MDTQTSVTRPEVRSRKDRVPRQTNERGRAPAPSASADYPEKLERRTIRRQPAASSAPEKEVRRRKPWKAAGKDIRISYGVYLESGFVLALLALIGLMRAPIHFKTIFEVPVIEQEIVQMEEIQQTKQKVEAPPPRRPPVPIEVPNDEVIDDEALNLDVALDIDEMVLDLAPPALPPPEEEESVESEIFVVVEEMPTLIGGTARLYQLVEYPDIARKAGLEGTVIVGLVVETDGTPGEVMLLKSVHDILDNAALAAVRQVRFTPGRQRGRAVRVKMAIPIRFKLR